MAGMISDPLVRKELRQNLRGPAALVLENLYLLGIAVTAVVAVLIYGAGSGPGWVAGEGGFFWLVAIQAVLGVVLGATVAAPSMTVEAEQKTLDTLTTTPLGSAGLIWSKLLSSFLVGAAMLSMSVPIAAGVFVLGGVSLGPAIAVRRRGARSGMGAVLLGASGPHGRGRTRSGSGSAGHCVHLHWAREVLAGAGRLQPPVQCPLRGRRTGRARVHGHPSGMGHLSRALARSNPHTQ
jgi:hypothetical protein